MNFLIEKSFEKDFKKLKNVTLATEILEAINNVKNANSITEIANLKKLKGTKNDYRIRCGNYRIGITIKSDVVIFVAFDHRKDIYKRFP